MKRLRIRQVPHPTQAGLTFAVLLFKEDLVKSDAEVAALPDHCVLWFGSSFDAELAASFEKLR